MLGCLNRRAPGRLRTLKNPAEPQGARVLTVTVSVPLSLAHQTENQAARTREATCLRNTDHFYSALCVFLTSDVSLLADVGWQVDSENSVNIKSHTKL